MMPSLPAVTKEHYTMCTAFSGLELRTQDWVSGGLSCPHGQAGDFTAMGDR